MVEFRQLTVEDVDAATEIFVNIFTQPPWLDVWDSIEHAKTYLQDFFNYPGFVGVAAIHEGKFLGFGIGNIRHWWQGEEYFLYEFGIDPACQSQGIGGKLLQYMEEVLKTKQVSAITLLTERATMAEQFYLKHDFHVSEDTIFMVKIFES